MEIYNGELSLRGIKVFNFAADGDSRLLKTMRITNHLTSGNTTLSLNNESTLLNTPPSFNKWLRSKAILYLLCARHDTHCCEVQDKAIEAFYNAAYGVLCCF